MPEPVTVEQPRDMRGRYRGNAMTPAYRRRLLGCTPLGRQILKDEDAGIATGRSTTRGGARAG